MKKQTSQKAGFVPKFLHSLLLGVFLFMAAAATAQNINPLLQSVRVKPLSAVGDRLLFQVFLQNVQQDRFSIMIKDDQGTVLFHKYFQDKNFEQRFLLEHDGEDRKLTFVIRTVKDGQSLTYEINKNTKVVEDYVVTRL